MTSKILFVDDDPNLLAAFQRNLRKQFTFDTAVSGADALNLLRLQGPYALIVADMRMPVMDGVEFLEKARAIDRHAVRIMLTGNAEQQTAADAVNRGEVYRFLNKPCAPDILVAALHTGLRQFELQSAERELLEGTLMGAVKVMSEVLGMVAPDALGRGQRLRECIRQFALFTGAEPIWELEVAALLSPVGYAALPPDLLYKLGLGEDISLPEETLIRHVPRVGHGLLATIPRLENVARIVLYQNQSFNGQGFPSDGCLGEQLPIGARMLKILNDRMALERDGVVKQHAVDAMKSRHGVYDPQLLLQCFACFPNFLSNALSSAAPVHRVTVDCLLPDQIVVSDITTLKGLVLVAAGNCLTPMVLERLRNYRELGDVKEPVLIQDPAEVSARATSASAAYGEVTPQTG